MTNLLGVPECLVYWRYRVPAGELYPRHMLRWRSVVAAVAVLACLGMSATAAADTPVLPTSDALPWTDPNHHSPLEVLVTSIASTIAQRPVRVYCDGQTEWDALGASREFDANG
jgi:hypothetical protein